MEFWENFRIGAYLIMHYSLCLKILPILYIANPNPNPTGPSTPQYGNYPEKNKDPEKMKTQKKRRPPEKWTPQEKTKTTGKTKTRKNKDLAEKWSAPLHTESSGICCTFCSQ